MSSGADLFVVCKQCGAEVSPYITECPYCGNRLRKRAPKLPSKLEKGPAGGSRSPLKALSGRMGQTGSRRSSSGRLRAKRPGARALRRRSGQGGASRVLERSGFSSQATVLLVALSCVGWVATSSGYLGIGRFLIVGPIHGDWWKLVSSQFVYGSDFSGSVFAFCTILAIAVFGWLMEQRHGPIVVLVLFLAAGALGAYVGTIAYAEPIISGGNGAALGLIAAWAVPDLLSAREGSWYEGDLLGAGAIALVILAIPLARPEVSWLAGLVGGLVGLLAGLVLNMASGEA